MSTDSAVTWLTWILVVVAAAALVLVVVVRRWAARIAVLAGAVVVLLGCFAVRARISSLAETEPAMLCQGGVSWFGIELTGSDKDCESYR